MHMHFWIIILLFSILHSQTHYLQGLLFELLLNKIVLISLSMIVYIHTTYCTTLHNYIKHNEHL